MPHFRRVRFWTPIAVALAVLGGACSESASPDVSTADSLDAARGGRKAIAPATSGIAVTLVSPRLTVGQSTQASAVAKDSRGSSIGGKVFTWVAANPNVASVTSTGLVAALGPGVSEIKARVDGVTGSTLLTVVVDSAPKPGTIAVALGAQNLSVGQNTQAAATVYDNAGNAVAGAMVAWTSSNTAIATVSAAGLVTGVAAGSADVIATHDGKIGKTTITVAQASVAYVTVALDSTSLTIGKTTQATATTRDANYGLLTGRAIAWSSSNTAVATVTATGIVSAIAPGTANIIATSEGKSGQAALTTKTAAVSVASVSVALAANSINIGQTTQATATTRDANNAVLTGRAIAWSSSNTAVATVSNTGVVTAVATGTANIVATSEGKTGQAAATVSAVPVASVSVALAASSINVGQATQATATTRDASNNVMTGRAVAWSSSNSAVATVNVQTGVVTAVLAGTANIVATSEGKTGQATLTVTVAQLPVASVSVTVAASSISAGQTTQASAVTRDASNNVLTGRVIGWTSSSPSVATVNLLTGLVTGVAGGTTTITATSEGKTGSATVTVSASAGGSSGGGSAALSGTVADQYGARVGGGVVEILQGSNVVQTAPVNSFGTFSVSSLPAGAYDLRLQPPLTHSMGPNEPATRQASITAGQNATVAFAVQAALYADDFQRYTSSSQFTSGSMTSGNFWSGANGGAADIGAVSTPAAIAFDPTGGIYGDKSMRYDWPAKPTAACSIETTVGVMPRLNPPPVGTKDLWVRFTSKESPNFEHGRTGCVRSYKFFLIQLESGTTNGRFGTYLFDGVGPNPGVAARLYMDMNDNRGAYNAVPSTLPIGGEPTWGGAYHTWVLEMRGIGTGTTTFRVYKDGALIGTLSGAFLNGQTLGAGWNIMFEMGANINNGPDHTQSRWWREFGVYTTRPSLLPLK